MARKLTKRQSSTARTSTKIYYAASFDEIVGRQMVSQNPERAVRTRNRSPLNSRNEKPALAHGRSQP